MYNYHTESYSLHAMQLVRLWTTQWYFCFPDVGMAGGSLLGMRNINCKPHWLAVQLTTIKMGIYQVRCTCYLYLKKAFLINSSEETSLEKNSCRLFSVNKENLFTFWICLDFFCHKTKFLFFICFARHRQFTLLEFRTVSWAFRNILIDVIDI